MEAHELNQEEAANLFHSRLTTFKLIENNFTTFQQCKITITSIMIWRQQQKITYGMSVCLSRRLCVPSQRNLTNQPSSLDGRSSALSSTQRRQSDNSCSCAVHPQVPRDTLSSIISILELMVHLHGEYYYKAAVSSTQM